MLDIEDIAAILDEVAEAEFPSAKLGHIARDVALQFKPVPNPVLEQVRLDLAVLDFRLRANRYIKGS